MHEHIVDDFDVKIVGPEREVERFRRHIARADQALSMVQYLRESGREVTPEDLATIARTLGSTPSEGPEQ